MRDHHSWKILDTTLSALIADGVIPLESAQTLWWRELRRTMPLDAPVTDRILSNAIASLVRRDIVDDLTGFLIWKRFVEAMRDFDGMAHPPHPGGTPRANVPEIEGTWLRLPVGPPLVSVQPNGGEA